VLLRLAIEDRQAMLDEARAMLRQRQIEYDASKELQTKGFRSETSMAAAAAELDAAQAAVKQMEIDLERTTIVAPFEGVLGWERVELGDYVSAGDAVATVVDLDPLLVVGFASEREVAALQPGAPGSARLVDGSMVEGRLSFVAPQADAQTRTYRFELEVPNPDGRIRAGLSAEVAIPVEEMMAHVLSPAVLTLADNGTLGVKIVGADNRVAFVPVQIVGESEQGIWVTGLPTEVTLITVGQEFVVTGQEVAPVAADIADGRGGA
jgi:multidrug efflux system membrane fusion protein